MRRPCRSPDPPGLELLISFTIASARAADAKRVGKGIVVLVCFLSYEFSDLEHSSDYMGTPLTSYALLRDVFEPEVPLYRELEHTKAAHTPGVLREVI